MVAASVFLKFSFHYRWAMLLAVIEGVRATRYGLVKDHSGGTFFDGWSFYDHYDNTSNGDTLFLSAQNASTQRLAYIDSATNRAVIKVDNTSFVPWNFKRNSVRISTKNTYGIGTVFVVDLWHAPYGCSVWPAVWTFSPTSLWPAGGEMDLFEGINLSPRSQMGLHTTAGCAQLFPKQTSKVINGTNCEGPTGCIVTNDSPVSYGPAFANAQGGVFAGELSEAGVSIWFFERSKVPDGLKNNESRIDTSEFGTPTANWPASGCSIDKYFEPQTLVFDITLCGDFAGSPEFFPLTCTGNCYLDYVINNGTEQYANAYFEVGYVRIFSANSTGPSLTVVQQSGGGRTTTTLVWLSVIVLLGVVLV